MGVVLSTSAEDVLQLGIEVDGRFATIDFVERAYRLEFGSLAAA